jgi:hypothetical protein
LAQRTSQENKTESEDKKRKMKKNFGTIAATYLLGLGSVWGLGSTKTLAQANPPMNAPAPNMTAAPVPNAAASPLLSTTETIVLIRHGEKTSAELGQLNRQGLNRALALPNVLIRKYGNPNYLFAPNPADQIRSITGGIYSYVRPLATIEPLAIQEEMPVNTQFGFRDIKPLEAELIKPMYASSLIFVSWEHLMEDQFAKNVMADYGKDASAVPDWSNSDYDMLFVIHLVRSAGSTKATFQVDHEELNGKLSTKMPTAAGM